jgi:hypothetical protein
MIEAIPNKYFSLPPMVGLDRSEYFIYLVERVIECLKGWKEEIIYLGWKRDIIESIRQSIHVYAMTVFMIPKILCKELNDAMARFGGEILMS